MTYITIPTAARALSTTIAAEAAVIRRACNTWTTPAALEAAERAADRMSSGGNGPTLVPGKEHWLFRNSCG